jgi:phage terminase large subunit
MPLSIPQQKICNSKKRFRVAVCGRRFGKTFLAMTEIAKVARYPDKNVYVIYPTYKQAKKVLWKSLRKKMVAVNWVSKINETELTLELKNGSVITLVGADNFDSLRGVGLDAAILDEFQMLDKEAWTEVIRPALSDRQGSALFIGTPNGVGSFAHELYNRGKQDKNWESFTFTTIEGGNVTQEEIDQAREDLDDRTFKQEYCASFETYSNACYYAFSRDQNIRPFDGALPRDLYVGIDFNVGVLAVSIFVKLANNVIHQVDEIALTSTNTDEAVDELLNRYPNKRIITYPDPAGNQRKTSASGKTDITILRNAGFEVKVKAAHNPVRDGINAVNAKLCNSKGQVTYFIDPKCKQTINSMERYSYKEGSSVPDKDGVNDHFADSIRYFIDYDYSIKRDYAPEQLQPQRFGHAIS